MKRDFNPRTHIECDKGAIDRPRYAAYFNPRTHIECDLSGLSDSASVADFNPRTHIECDSDGVLALCINTLSTLKCETLR